MKQILPLLLCNMLYHSSRPASNRARTSIFRQFPYDAQVIAQNLYVPWALAISDEGDIYFTERSGALRVIREGILNPQPLITFNTPPILQGEDGLLGIALDPNFSQNHYIYVMHSYQQNNQIFNRVVRLVENNDTATLDQILIDEIPGSVVHDGGRIKIGPDQKLYITTGDSGRTLLAQDLISLAGKILRINLDGTIPEDNPFPGSSIYTFGHRDPQGLAWNLDNIMYASEHGPAAHDEINIIQPGANYGWPLIITNEAITTTTIQQPLINSEDVTWAPSGIAFITEGPLKGHLLVATLRGQQLLDITLSEGGMEVLNITSHLVNEYGRLREVIQGPDGSLYITTSNRDGRGTPNSGDDKIIKFIPK